MKFNDHEYFGQWFPKYDPKLHDAIMGPVEEFVYNESAVGYDEAKAGGEFVRIGVGALRKPDETKFQRFKTYDIVDTGKWTVRKGGIGSSSPRISGTTTATPTTTPSASLSTKRSRE